jgi:hypothetical protein
VAASWVAAGGSGGVTGAEPVAGIPGLIPGFVTEARVHGRFPGFATVAAILMVRTGSVWPVLWRRLVEVLAGVLAASWVAVGVLVV